MSEARYHPANGDDQPERITTNTVSIFRGDRDWWYADTGGMPFSDGDASLGHWHDWVALAQAIIEVDHAKSEAFA